MSNILYISQFLSKEQEKIAEMRSMINIVGNNGLDKALDDTINGNWNKLYTIYPELPLFYKLSDGPFWISLIQNKIKRDVEFKAQFRLQQDKLEQLKQIKIWSKNNMGILKLTLFDVYTSFLVHLKTCSFEEQLFTPQDISLMGPLGPFKATSLISCLNDELIGSFVFNCLLKNQLPQRNLRVHTRGQVKIEFGHDLTKVSVLDVKQITESGILFSCASDEFNSYVMDKSQVLKIYFDTRVLSQLAQNEKKPKFYFGNELFFTNNALRYFKIDQQKLVKSLSYNSDVTNEIFYFCRYNHMLDSAVALECQGFMENFKQAVISRNKI